MQKWVLYLGFGVVSLLVQAATWYLFVHGQPVPRMSFLTGPFALYFLFMGLHPAYRGEASERSAQQHQVMLGVLTLCAVFAIWNYRFMR